MDFRSSPFEILTATGALFLALLFIAIFMEVGAIEDDLAVRVGDAVRQENLFWASVEVRGQSIRLTGAAPAAEDRERAGRVAKGVWGVAGLDNRIQVIGESGTCQNTLDGRLSDERVRFKRGKAEVLPESYPLLRVLASVVLSCGTAIEIAGHTDSVGDAAVNLRLSQRRADAVARHLVQSGVDATLLRAVGYGETQPVGDNATEEGQQANRRIEFRVIGGAS